MTVPRRRLGPARVGALVAVWTIAIPVIASCALSAFLMSLDWGDGSDAASDLEVAGVIAAGVATVLVAVWLTRRLVRR